MSVFAFSLRPRRQIRFAYIDAMMMRADVAVLRHYAIAIDIAILRHAGDVFSFDIATLSRLMHAFITIFADFIIAAAMLSLMLLPLSPPPCRHADIFAMMPCCRHYCCRDAFRRCLR